MTGPDKLGHAEGDKRGPEPGEGAVIHHQSGEADFDGLPGDELPPRKDPVKAPPAPPDRSAD